MIQVLSVLFQWCWQEYVRPYLINQKVGSIIRRTDDYPVEKYLYKKPKIVLSTVYCFIQWV